MPYLGSAVRIDLMNRYPVLKNGTGEAVLNWIAKRYLEDLENVKSRINELIKLLEIFSASMAEDLTEDGKTISWVRLSEFPSREMVASGILKPVSLMVRTQQYIFYAIVLLLLFMPVVIIKFPPEKPGADLEDEKPDSI